MASSSKDDVEFEVPSSSRQIGFHQLLVAARKTWLVDALGEALAEIDPALVKTQMKRFAPADAQQILAQMGIRDEHVFPVPALLEGRPTLVGYYRLLLGAPRKRFYNKRTGLGIFQNAEKKGVLGKRQREAVPAFCTAMGKELAVLVRELSPQITWRDVSELPLLTLGALLQGANNVRIGEEAKAQVFARVREAIKAYIQQEQSSRLTIVNPANRTFTVVFSADPDIKIREETPQGPRNAVAIEIKGGEDASNAYNRAGEAEKSHLTAKRQDYRDFWTLVVMRGVRIEKLKEKSPSTRSWFDVTQILAQSGPDWEEFRSRLTGALGIPVAS